VKIEEIVMIPGSKRRRPSKACLVLFFATAMLFAVCFAQAGDGSALVTQRCQGCHGLEKNCEVTTTDPDWWKETVLRMVEYKSGLLSEDEAAQVALFLADEQQRTTLCSSN
jgi:uncharacterized Fe-S center protein